MKRTYKFFNKGVIVFFYICATIILLSCVVLLIDDIVSLGVISFVEIIVYIGGVLFGFATFLFATFAIFSKIEFDFEKEEIYFLHICLINKRISFKDIKNLQVVHVNENVLDLHVLLNSGNKVVRFAKFYLQGNSINNRQENVKCLLEDLSRVQYYLNIQNKIDS